MLIIPAIDLKNGSVVRLFQGKFDESKTYSQDALKTAKHWIKQGAEYLHIVDLDGAKTGEPKNLGLVKKILQNIPIPLEFGGGVRDIETIELLLDAGITRVVLGTKAVQDRNFLQTAFKKFGQKIIVSIDAKDGLVAIKGWQESLKGVEAIKFALELKELGFEELIYTDISKDGTLSGPNIKAIKELLKETGLKVVASGGISSLDDIVKLGSLEKQGVTGIIIGKALYEGKFTLKEALGKIKK